MPSIFQTLKGLFPGFKSSYAAKVEAPGDRADRLLTETRKAIDRSKARPRPSTEEKIPSNYHGGAAGKMWFLPYQDSTTRDTPEIRAAMRLMRRDPYVRAAFEPQILAVASEDWQVQPAEPGNAEAEEQANFCKAVVEDHLADGIVALVRAICAPLGSEGHSLAEPVWAVARKGKEAGKIVCEKVAARDTDHAAGDCRLEGDRFGNVTGVQALRGEGQPVIPIEEFIFARYMTVFDEPLGEAVYRPSYGPYWMRDTVRKLRIIHCEKKMAGMLIGTYQDDDDRPALDERLRAARSATWMSVPEGVRIEAVQLSTASEPDYKSLEESLRDEVVTGIAFGTLQMLTSTATGDQRGSADVQKMVTDLGPWLLMTIVTNAVNRQLFPKLIDFNYPYPAGGAYPKLTFGAVSNADLLELLQVVTGAKGLGLKPSRKHYAKTLSIQEADPNDPDDQLDDPNAMGGFGGMPPSDPTGGFDPTGGAPQGMPPTDPTAGGGYEGFSERAGWHAFNWQAAPTRGNSGVKAVWVGAGQRRPLYGAAARRALGRGTSAPAQAAPPSAPPSAPNPPSPPAPPGVTLPGPTAGPLPGPGEPAPRGRRVKRVGRAALTVGQRLTQAGAKVAQGVGYASKKIGQALQSLGWVERNLLFGAGRALERSGRRQIEQSRQTAAMARDGRLGAAARRATRAVVGAAGVKWVENRRRYGFVAATVMEAAFWALKLGPAAVGAGLAAGALTGSLGVATVAGVSAAAVAKAVLGPALTPVLRSLIAMPFRRGRGKRGANAPQRKLARQIRRAAKKGVPFSPPAGTAPEVVAKARELAATSSDPGRALYTPGRKTSRRRFSEAAAFAEGGDPFDLVVAARDTIDELSAAGGDAPPDLSDDQLSALLAELFEYVEGLADDSGERVQAFAERHGAGAAWERFGWQAGRTRTQSVKAIGTGPDAGKTLYGANARAALARSAGASKRQDAPRAVSYDVTDGEGNVARKRETNVSPERARAMAVAAQLAATEPVTGPRPTQLRVTKDRKPKAIADAESRLESAAARVATGDPAAAKEIGEHGKATTDLAAKEIAAVPAPPPAVQAKIRGAWARAAKGMGATEAKQLGSMVGELARGFDSDAAAAGRWAGKVAGFVGKLSYGTAKLAVKGLARFAKFGLRAAGGAARLAYRGAKAVVGSDTARPFLYWAAAMTAGAALVAAPALAVSAGLVKFSVGLGLAAPSVAASVYVMRKIGRRAADAGLELKGEGFLVPRSAAERMSEALGGPLDALFGAAAGRLVEAFAWDDWRQDGERWKSPGGRYLSDAAYQRMKGRASGGNRGETPQTVSPRSGSADGRGPAAPAKRFAPPAAPQPGRVYQVDPTRIAVDPGRFQFKLNTDPSGVTKELQSVAKFDPELAGVVAVWKDPADGKTYVVNGHHRLELAKRTGTRDVAVRYLSAATAEEARAKGALINIAEGRGTAVDAAKFLRDSGRTAEDLAAVGVSLKGQVARDAVELAKLSPALFRRVTFGAVEPERAVAVARHLGDHAAQEKLIGAVEKQEERSGRPVPPRVVEAMAQEYRDAPTLSRTTDSLFGAIEEDESTYFHRAELKSYVRQELAKEARDFRLGASTRRAEALKSVSGNSLATDENKKVADRADGALATFDGQARLKGPLSDLLNDFAVEYANATASGRNALRPKVLAAVRALLSGAEPGGVDRVQRRGPGLFD